MGGRRVVVRVGVVCGALCALWLRVEGVECGGALWVRGVEIAGVWRGSESAPGAWPWGLGG